MMQMSPETHNNVLNQARSALDAGQPQRAVDLLWPVSGTSSEDPQHWFLLGTALGMVGDARAAEQALRESLKLNATNLQALMNLGRALLEQEKFDEATETIKQVLAINPGHRQARVSLVNALVHLKRYVEAEACCNSLVQNSPGDIEAYVLLGNVYKAKSDFNLALTMFDKALSLDPGSVVALMNKGLALRSMGKNALAMECFEPASRLVPENPNVWYIKGITNISLNSLEQAAEDLEAAFRLNPRDINAGSQLASVYRHLRRLPESVEVSRRILAVDPGNVRARFYTEVFAEGSGGHAVQRIPREVAEATYSQADVGKNFEASLKGGLEYRAPEVLSDAVRDVFGNREASIDVLEIGCGTGLCGSRFADMARTLVGTDLSASMLEVAREKHAYTDLYVADLVDVLSDNHDAFDLVIAMDVLCYFGDLTDIFRQCHQTLRTDGVFAFSVEKPDDDELWQLHPYGHFVHSLAHLRQVAKATGFQELFVREMALRREALEQRIGFVCLYKRES